MHRSPPIAILALLCLLAGLPAAGAPQEPAAPEAGESDAPAPEAETPTDPLAKAALLALPGEFHAHLEPHVGTWDLTIRVWQSLDGEPVESQGRAEARWILGDRFLESLYVGEIMGQPFEARSIEGYDNQAKQFVRVWWDTMGTYTMVFRGTCGTTCKARTLTADFTDPISGQRLRNKGLTTFGKRPQADGEEEPAPAPVGEGTVDLDRFLYESFIVMPDGSEFKNMEMVAERR